jgi:hypothetical protein
MKRTLLSVLLVVLVGDAAQAASYGVNFDGAYRAPPTPIPANDSFGPLGAIQQNWNNIHAPNDVNDGPWNGSFDITDKNGLNPITVNITMHNAGGNDGSGGGATDIDILYRTGLRDNDGVIHLSTVAAPFGRYDLYVYSGNNPNGGVFQEGVNYTKQVGLTGPLSIDIGSLNGFSIVPGPPEVNNDLGVKLLRDGMLAALQGTLQSEGGGGTTVWVYWGSTDGITNKLAWDTNYPFGMNTLPCPVLYTNFVIGPLGLRTDYWYRYYASNSAGTCWATNSVFFKSDGGSAIIVR